MASSLHVRCWLDCWDLVVNLGLLIGGVTVPILQQLLPLDKMQTLPFIAVTIEGDPEDEQEDGFYGSNFQQSGVIYPVQVTLVAANSNDYSPTGPGSYILEWRHTIAAAFRVLGTKPHFFQEVPECFDVRLKDKIVIPANLGSDQYLVSGFTVRCCTLETK